ncbi:hypothetical protein [Anaerohalosphaera lusitana]|uniref:hypothetical protein n=1 Tax=Anaerohalosphaera lusitana TaxID=1936003 RepID=UPI0011BAA5A6|nr:hypothetical protein [Anaerohalosphaera lusitana]
MVGVLGCLFGWLTFCDDLMFWLDILGCVGGFQPCVLELLNHDELFIASRDNGNHYQQAPGLALIRVLRAGLFLLEKACFLGWFVRFGCGMLMLVVGVVGGSLGVFSAF